MRTRAVGRHQRRAAGPVHARPVVVAGRVIAAVVVAAVVVVVVVVKVVALGDRERRVDVGRDELPRGVVDRDLDAGAAQRGELVGERVRLVGDLLEALHRRAAQRVLGIGLAVRALRDEDHDGADREQHELHDPEHHESRRERAPELHADSPAAASM